MFSGTILCSQTSPVIDSLERAYSPELNDSLRIRILKNISWEYLNNRYNAELAEQYIDDVLVAEEASLPRAIAETLRAHRFAIEGSAAVVVAALLDGLVDARQKRVGLVLTGKRRTDGELAVL